MPLADVLVSSPEPRQARKKRRDLVETPVVAVCEVLAGADNFVEIEMWACDNFEWFRRYLNLENSIASHDTFGRLFGVIEAQAFASALCRWVSGTLPALAAQELAAIDGKTSRRPGKLDASALHRVSAFAAGAKLLPGQTAAAPTS